VQDAGKPQRHPNGIARTALNIAVGHLDYDFRPHENSAALLLDFEDLQTLGHLLEIRISETLEGLADLQVLTGSWISRGKMIVR